MNLRSVTYLLALALLSACSPKEEAPALQEPSRVEMALPQPQTKAHFEDVNGTASFVCEAIEGEGLILRLDNAGGCGSTGSACSTGSLDPSHVLMAIGLPHEIAHGSLRLTLGEDNTREEMDYVVEKIKGIVERLRSMSPLYEDFVKAHK